MTPRERLSTARLYLVCPARSREWIAAAVRGGVDLVQLRDKSLDDAGLVEAAARSSATTRCSSSTTGPTWWRPARPTACTSARTTRRRPQARALIGPDRILGRSTHEPAQAAAADADPDVDYVAVGPVHATPTKPGRPAAGLHYVAHAASTVGKPWFAIGGLDAGNVHEVLERGATRIVVVRAITEAEDPEAAARELRAALEEPARAGH